MTRRSCHFQPDQSSSNDVQPSHTSGNALIQAPIPPNEPERLRELADYQIIDTLPEQFYDDIVRLAAYICQTPIALVNLIDHNRQWSKAQLGFAAGDVDRNLAMCAFAINHPDEVMVIPDATSDPRFATNPFVAGDPHIRFYAGAPLVTPSGLALGTVCVIDRQPRQLSAEQLEMLRALSRQVIVQFELRRNILRLEQRVLQQDREYQALYAHLQQLELQLIETRQQSLTDPLTGLHNRRGFDQRLREEFGRARRYQTPLALLLIDVDRFKQFNDTFGHLAGDETLRVVAKLLNEGCRTYDVLARYGGEEFAVILPATSHGGSQVLAERLRRIVQQAAWPYQPVTISIGGAILTETMADVCDLIEEADRALYAAKRNGRNCCVFAS